MYLSSINNEKKVMVKSTKCPKMIIDNGRSWSVYSTLKIENKEVEVLADTTWGTKGYIIVGDVCYSADLMDYDCFNHKETVELKRGRF